MNDSETRLKKFRDAIIEDQERKRMDRHTTIAFLITTAIITILYLAYNL